MKRLTPVTKIGKATEQGIEAVCAEVLAPVFHGPDAIARKVSRHESHASHDRMLYEGFSISKEVSRLARGFQPARGIKGR